VAIRENSRLLVNYPDPDAKMLRIKIGEHVGVSPDSIVCGNGSTELIYLLVRAVRPKGVLIPEPTFSEYERACATSHPKIEVGYHLLDEESSFVLDPDKLIRDMVDRMGSDLPGDMVFVCNPNNPTGRLVTRADMLRVAHAARECKCTLVVDEAFVDFCPDASLVKEVARNPYLVVLRSLTKFYALSGLRIGYAVLPPSILAAVKESKEPWTVNTLAQAAGAAVLGDAAYQRETFRVIGEQKAHLEKGFRRLGISYCPSAANYYLLRLDRAQEVSAFLKAKGILVRDCSNFMGLDETYIRVAVKGGKDNTRLIEEIAACLA